jgi:hypothetical protein
MLKIVTIAIYKKIYFENFMRYSVITFVWSIDGVCPKDFVKDYSNCLVLLPTIKYGMILNRLFNSVSKYEFKLNGSVLTYSIDKSYVLYSKNRLLMKYRHKKFH